MRSLNILGHARIYVFYISLRGRVTSEARVVFRCPLIEEFQGSKMSSIRLCERGENEKSIFLYTLVLPPSLENLSYNPGERRPIASRHRLHSLESVPADW